MTVKTWLESGPVICVGACHCTFLLSGQHPAEDEIITVLETCVGALREVDSPAIEKAVGEVEVEVSRTYFMCIDVSCPVEQHQLAVVSPSRAKLGLFV